ncbi:MAG TPA: amidohydrolase family protein [Gaiellaceae bacterium]|nr:amidohydrolase family protein [Gaiellaceae bacterium]
MGGLLPGRRRIRAAGPLREVLSEIPLVDHHAHGILRAQPSLDEFRGLFSESPDPRQWPHVATGVTYRRGIRELAELFGVEPAEEAVLAYRLATEPREYARRLLAETNTEHLLLDDGFPPTDVGTSWDELADWVGIPARPVLRVETHPLEDVGNAREQGFVALKTIAAYRGGLDRVGEQVVAALEANEAGGDPLPVQVHCGFGDSDLHLWRSDPSYLKPLVERFRETPFVLLHCYPYVREAGWLAHVYGNVWFDLSLTIPHVSQPAQAIREALELAPVSKLLYASDAARTPELYYLAARWWRRALGEVLPELLPERDVEEAARRILRENARRLYRL